MEYTHLHLNGQQSLDHSHTVTEARCNYGTLITIIKHHSQTSQHLVAGLSLGRSSTLVPPLSVVKVLMLITFQVNDLNISIRLLKFSIKYK